MLPSRVFGSALLAAWGLAGCADESAEERGIDGDLDALSSGRRAVHGVVSVERVEGDESTRTSVSAKFLRVLPSDLSLAERVVGSSPMLPESTECVDLASLELDEAEAQRASLRPDLSVDLVDVGDVTLRLSRGLADDLTPFLVALAPRAFPDVGDLASGVFYTSPDADQDLPAPATYELGGSGADALDAFSIDVTAPESPSGLRFDGASVGDDPVSIGFGADLRIEWASPAVRDDGMIYVDVRGAQVYRCAFPDAGLAVLPAGVLVPGSAHDLAITVHRLTERQAALRSAAAGEGPIGAATVRFDLARTLRLSVR